MAGTQPHIGQVNLGMFKEQPILRKDDGDLIRVPNHLSAPQGLHEGHQPSTQEIPPSRAHSRHSLQSIRIRERTDAFPDPENALPNPDPWSQNPPPIIQNDWENFQPNVLFPNNCDEFTLPFSVRSDEDTRNDHPQRRTSEKRNQGSNPESQIDPHHDSGPPPLDTRPASGQMTADVRGGCPRQEWPLLQVNGSMNGAPENADTCNHWPCPSGGWFSVMPTTLDAQDW